MRAFRNLKIIWKIFLSAMPLGLIVVIIAWESLSALSSTSRIASNALDESAQKVFLANSASFNVNSTTTDDREVVLAKTKEDLEKAAKQFDDDLAAGRKPLADLYKLELAVDRRAKITAIEKQIDDFEKTEKRAFDLARSGKIDEAYGLIAGDAFKFYSTAMDGLAEVVKLEQDDISAARSMIDVNTWATLRAVMATTIIGFIFGFGALGAAGLLQISRPIGDATAALRKLASGELDVDIPGRDRGDEVGEIGRAAQIFKEALITKKAAEERTAEEAESKLRRAAQIEGKTRDFECAIGTLIGHLSSSSTELEAAAGTLTKTAETTQTLSTSVAAASEEASVNVQSVASAAEELSASVNEIARQVQESSEIAAQAVQQAKRTDARISELSQAAGRIGDVVKLITGVAEQTNLLALNATIEAARAGEAGRGFAVVASEVKALAGQTAKATEEISSQIAGMQAATQESVAAIKEIGGTIARISEIASAIAAAVQEQGASTQEISRNVQQAAHGTAQVATNITDVERGAGETGSASAQVLASAQTLSRENNRLKSEVDNFLASVRVA
jgi:methyl-accepting chemotaxis protein